MTSSAHIHYCFQKTQAFSIRWLSEPPAIMTDVFFFLQVYHSQQFNTTVLLKLHSEGELTEQGPQANSDNDALRVPERYGLPDSLHTEVETHTGPFCHTAKAVIPEV